MEFFISFVVMNVVLLSLVDNGVDVGSVVVAVVSDFQSLLVCWK